MLARVYICVPTLFDSVAFPGTILAVLWALKIGQDGLRWLRQFDAKAISRLRPCDAQPYMSVLVRTFPDMLTG